ncbi:MULTISPECIES: hypothetical protein [unclassified Streptomyces]|uniref:hypothetical protein n=1 Tax=unclassified Streptomyces TaxID=2593676 RepID=UPI00381CE837
MPRPRWLEGEHTGLDGFRTVTVFTDAMARLVCHEVDHLYGALRTARMSEGIQPISVTDYKGTGTTWPSGLAGVADRVVGVRLPPAVEGEASVTGCGRVRPVGRRRRGHRRRSREHAGSSRPTR